MERRLRPFPKQPSLTRLSKRLDLPVAQVTKAVRALHAGQLMSTAGASSGIKSGTMHAIGQAIGWNPTWRNRDLLKRPRAWRISETEVLRLDAHGASYRVIGMRAGVTGEAIRQFLKARGRPQRMKSAAERRALRIDRERQRRQQATQARREKRAQRLDWLRSFLTPAMARYTAGESYADIARRLGITRDRLGYLIHRYRDRIGDAAFSRRVIPAESEAGRAHLRTRLAPIRTLYAQGASIAALARVLGCTRQHTDCLIQRARRLLGPDSFPPRR